MLKKSNSRPSYSAKSRQNLLEDQKISSSKEHSLHTSNKSSSNLSKNVKRMQSAKLPSLKLGSQPQSQLESIISKNAENNNSANLLPRKAKIPQYLKEMNILEKKQNEKIIKNMNKRINFKRNPRFEIVRPPIQFTDLESKKDLLIDVDSSSSLFRAIPSYLLFQNYLINEVYEINLKIVNVTKISRRIKFLPPQSNQFTISKVVYPAELASKYDLIRTNGFQEDITKEKGMIAPGMSLSLNIKFFASSFSEFRDEITFISEENIFKIPIIAQKEAPLINLPEILDCQSCWLGDQADIVFKIVNKGGEAGFKFFSEDSSQDAKQIGDTLQTECFTIYPSEFYIQKNEIIDICVTFTPKKEGVTQEKVILACDNLTSAAYTLKGTGNMAELGIHGIDHVILSEIPEVNQLDPQNVVKKIFFNDAYPGTVVSRYISIQNKASVRVKYHWSVSKTDVRQQRLNFDKPEDYCFSIEPDQGYFEPNEIKRFKVLFSSQDPIPIFEFANLIIDDISIQCIRNPPESIKISNQIPQILSFEEQNENQKQGDLTKRDLVFIDDGIVSSGNQLDIGKQIVKPGFLGSNTDRSSLTYFEFELIGLSTYSQVSIDPPFYVFPGQLFVNKLYYKEFNLINHSDSEIQFNISVCEAYYNQTSILGDIKEQSGVIGPKQVKAVTVGFISKEVRNNKSITFRVDFDKAHSQMMELIGDFVGPSVSFSVPMIDFGLFKAGDVAKYKLELKNSSDVEAEILFKESNQDGSFDDHKEIILRRLENEKANSNQKFLYTRDENEKFYKKAIERVCFYPPAATIPPKGKIEIEVKCGCEDACSINQIIELMVKSGKSIFIELIAEIQKIHITLNRFQMQPETLYACNQYSFVKGKTPQYIEMQNLGNIPCSFEWETEANDQVKKREHIKYNFMPVKGVIPPKSKLPIKFELQPLEGGQLNEIFVLNSQGIENPLGFEFKADVFGLSVEYELLDSNTQNIQYNQNPLEASVNALVGKNQKKSMIFDAKSQTQNQNQKLAALEFYDCKINKPKTIKICIKNTSGVNTTFELFTSKYEPFMNDEVKSPTSALYLNSIAEDLSLISGLQSQNLTGKFSPMNLEDINNNNQNKAIRFSQSINSVPSQIVKKESMIRINTKSLKPLPPRPVVLLTDDIEKKNNFTSNSGQALNQTKRLEKDQRIYLANNKGIAILCEPNKGKLKPHSEVVIKITCFNDICGSFKDDLSINVKGLPIQKFPLVVEVKGSPVIVLPSQLGMSYKGDWPCFNFGTFMKNISVMKREFKIQNSGPKDLTMDWKLFNLDEQKDVSDFFKIKVEDPHLGTDNVCQLKFEPIEPKEAEQSPFKIIQKSVLIDGRQDKSIQIEYESQQEANYNYVMVGKPRLVNPTESQTFIEQNEMNLEDHPLLNMGTIAIYLKAQSLYPQLYFDKLKNVEGSHKLKFQKWALQENKKQTKEICLVNLLQCNLIFSISIVGPFKLVQSATNSPAKFDQQKSTKLVIKDKNEIETKFNLVQNSNIKLKINFQGADINDTEEWPLTYKVYKYGVLQFNYINGDSQIIELEGQLLRPQLQLNTSGTEDVQGVDIQDFGIVHINNFKTIVIFLSNVSKVPAIWKLNHLKTTVRRGGSAIPQNTMTKLELEDSLRTDDPSVFEFQMTEGTLNGPSISVKSFPDTLALPTKKINAILHQQQLYPQKIYINFRPKTNILYKSKFRITVQEGPCLDFTLKGVGSYEENKFK
ncbi:hypothetical protein ABPG72_010264 [Tetrahymena utriculariae]